MREFEQNEFTPSNAQEIRQTPMGARGGQPTAGNGGSRKNHHDHSAEAQTNSNRRPWPVGYPQGLTRQSWAAPKVAGLFDLGAGLLTRKRADPRTHRVHLQTI